MTLEPDIKSLLLEIIDRYLTTWRPASASVIRTRIWDKAAVLAQLEKDRLLYRVDEEDSREPAYLPRMLAFDLLGNAHRFSYALKRAGTFLVHLRELAIKKGALEVLAEDLEDEHRYPGPPALQLCLDFSLLVESLDFIDRRDGTHPDATVWKIPRFKLRPAIRDFTDAHRAWVEELAACGIQPTTKSYRNDHSRQSKQKQRTCVNPECARKAQSSR
jgi:hypothetical protein